MRNNTHRKSLVNTLKNRLHAYITMIWHAFMSPARNYFLLLLIFFSLQGKVFSQPEYPSLVFYLYISHPGGDEYKIESFQLMSESTQFSNMDCLRRDTNTRYHSIFTFKPRTNIYRYELYNNYYYRIIITHSNDTMVVDFKPYGQSLTYHYYIDTVKFIPAYFEYDVEKAPIYKVSGVGNYHCGITGNIQENTPWLKEVKLSCYRHLITPCIEDQNTYMNHGKNSEGQAARDSASGQK